MPILGGNFEDKWKGQKVVDEWGEASAMRYCEAAILRYGQRKSEGQKVPNWQSHMEMTEM